MGVNIMLDFEVHGLADEAQTKSVLRGLVELIRAEGLQEHEVGLGWSVEGGRHWISGETDYPIGISRFHTWRPHFEAAFRERIQALAPAATAAINWRYPDDD
ncbi:hypothetical protein ACWCXK_03465 [Streptomyces sp. NPDC001739]|uniref:hypothetical protein n=1 Tax=Streptomyces sp. NPDC001657 TaxID=3154522 RepID=UPI00331B1FB4